MLQKIVTFCVLLLLMFSASCSSLSRYRMIEEGQEIVASEVNLGDDIFEAKDRLEAKGLRIKYGPSFPTESKSYYRMIVDYGARPNAWETFKYTVGFDSNGKMIYGVIEADPSGKITKIE